MTKRDIIDALQKGQLNALMPCECLSPDVMWTQDLHGNEHKICRKCDSPIRGERPDASAIPVNIVDPVMLQMSLEISVRNAVSKHVQDVADKACADLRKRICAQADALALSILQQYDVISKNDRVVITVNKAAEPKGAKS